jgi:hypothetical protein
MKYSSVVLEMLVGFPTGRPNVILCKSVEKKRFGSMEYLNERKRVLSSVVMTRKHCFFCDHKWDKIREFVTIKGADISDICSHKRDGLDSVVHNL